jgi:hypothetical protein
MSIANCGIKVRTNSHGKNVLFRECRHVMLLSIVIQ